MTDEQIIREVAERVMGWTWHANSVWVNHPDADSRTDANGAWERDNQYAAGRHWNPLSSWADARMVVERMRELRLELTLHGMGPDGFYAWFMPLHSSRTGPVAKESTAPRAITMAALQAVGEGFQSTRPTS